MTDYEEPEPDDGDDDDGADYDDEVWDDGVDPELRMYVHGANETQSSGFVSICLSVGGQTIVGTLLGHHQWQLAQVDQLEQGGAADAEDAEAIRRIYAESEALSAVESILSQKPRQPRFIHLRDVQILGGPAPILVPLWRGRLDAVDGWCLGSVAQQR